jgi:hypothetical protein
MRRMIALALVVVLVVVMVVPAAEAGGAATNIALGLASFAVFNSLFVAPFFYPRYAYAAPAPAYYYPAYPPVVVERPYYQTVYVQTPAPAPRYSNVVRYPHGALRAARRRRQRAVPVGVDPESASAARGAAAPAAPIARRH